MLHIFRSQIKSLDAHVEANLHHTIYPNDCQFWRIQSFVLDTILVMFMIHL